MNAETKSIYSSFKVNRKLAEAVLSDIRHDIYLVREDKKAVKWVTIIPLLLIHRWREKKLILEEKQQRVKIHLFRRIEEELKNENLQGAIDAIMKLLPQLEHPVYFRDRIYDLLYGRPAMPPVSSALQTRIMKYKESLQKIMEQHY